MDFKELIVEYPDTLPADLCDRLIEKFEKDRHHQVSGISAMGRASTAKISTDINFSRFVDEDEEWRALDSEVFECFGSKVSEYLQHLTDSFGYEIASPDVEDTGYQIQRTTPEGRYIWHTDDSTSIIANATAHPTEVQGHLAWYARRFATYIFYLNDQEGNFEGGLTQFKTGPGEIVEVVPERGKLIMFPANGLYPHQGCEVTKGSKYLATGWLRDLFVSTIEFSHSQTPKLNRIFTEEFGAELSKWRTVE